MPSKYSLSTCELSFHFLVASLDAQLFLTVVRSQLSGFRILRILTQVRSLSSTNVGLPALSGRSMVPSEYFPFYFIPQSHAPPSSLHSLQNQLPPYTVTHSYSLLPAYLKAVEGQAGRQPVVLYHLTSTRQGSHIVIAL